MGKQNGRKFLKFRLKSSLVLMSFKWHLTILEKIAIMKLIRDSKNPEKKGTILRYKIEAKKKQINPILKKAGVGYTLLFFNPSIYFWLMGKK